MKPANTTQSGERPVVSLRADELPAYCPNPSMPVWNHHPRVFLELSAGQTVLCPYCGTRYGLAAGPAAESTAESTVQPGAAAGR